MPRFTINQTGQRQMQIIPVCRGPVVWVIRPIRTFCQVCSYFRGKKMEKSPGDGEGGEKSPKKIRNDLRTWGKSAELSEGYSGTPNLGPQKGRKKRRRGSCQGERGKTRSAGSSGKPVSVCLRDSEKRATHPSAEGGRIIRSARTD